MAAGLSVWDTWHHHTLTPLRISPGTDWWFFHVQSYLIASPIKGQRCDPELILNYPTDNNEEAFAGESLSANKSRAQSNQFSRPICSSQNLLTCASETEVTTIIWPQVGVLEHQSSKGLLLMGQSHCLPSINSS